MLISDILEELQLKYPNKSKVELERIVDTQFKVIHDSMTNKTTKSIKLYNLGKVKPSTFFIKNHEKFSKKS